MFQFRWISRVQLHLKHIQHFMNPKLHKAFRPDHRLIGLAEKTWEAMCFSQMITFHYGTLEVATTQQLIAYSLQQSPCLNISLTFIFDLRSECKKVVLINPKSTANIPLFVNLANYVVIYQFPTTSTTSTTVTDLSGYGYTGTLSIFLYFNSNIESLTPFFSFI